jgi:hypothetical protein
VGEVPAAEGDDVLAWLALEPWDLFLDRSVGGAGGVPLDLRAAVSETTLGSAFKIRAIGLSELDQAGAISS